MGRHRAPDDDGEPIDEPSDDYPASEDFEDVGGYREPPGPPADEPSFPGSYPAPRYPSRPPEDFSDDVSDGPGFLGFDEPEDDPRAEFATPERDLPPPTSIRRTTSLTFRGVTRSHRLRPRARRPVAIGSSPISVAATATRRDGAASASEWSQR